jgi:CBS domain-containing protein
MLKDIYGLTVEQMKMVAASRDRDLSMTEGAKAVEKVWRESITSVSQFWDRLTGRADALLRKLVVPFLEFATMFANQVEGPINDTFEAISMGFDEAASYVKDFAKMVKIHLTGMSMYGEGFKNYLGYIKAEAHFIAVTLKTTLQIFGKIFMTVVDGLGKIGQLSNELLKFAGMSEETGSIWKSITNSLNGLSSSMVGMMEAWDPIMTWIKLSLTSNFTMAYNFIGKWTWKVVGLFFTMADKIRFLFAKHIVGGIIDTIGKIVGIIPDWLLKKAGMGDLKQSLAAASKSMQEPIKSAGTEYAEQMSKSFESALDKSVYNLMGAKDKAGAAYGAASIKAMNLTKEGNKILKEIAQNTKKEGEAYQVLPSLEEFARDFNLTMGQAAGAYGSFTKAYKIPEVTTMAAVRGETASRPQEVIKTVSTAAATKAASTASNEELAGPMRDLAKRVERIVDNTDIMQRIVALVLPEIAEKIQLQPASSSALNRF